MEAQIAPLLAPVIPVCGDIAPDAAILARAGRQKDRVKLCMRSTADFLVRPEFQAPAGLRPVQMKGFNHMDFFVGSQDWHTAGLLVPEC